MGTKALKRRFLMIAGILSVVIIVLTQSYFQPTESLQKKAKTEQSTEEQENQTFINAPSDMVPHGNAVAVSDSPASVPEKTSNPNESNKSSVVVKKVLVTFFKTLFRVIISPNAP
jgi:hypothetical protein